MSKLREQICGEHALTLFIILAFENTQVPEGFRCLIWFVRPWIRGLLRNDRCVRMREIIGNTRRTRDKWSNMKLVFDLGSRNRSSSPGIRALMLTIDCAWGFKSGKSKRNKSAMTHAMPDSRDLCDRQLLEVVLLQRRQNTRFETLIVTDEHAYICAGEGCMGIERTYPGHQMSQSRRYHSERR